MSIDTHARNEADFRTAARAFERAAEPWRTVLAEPLSWIASARINAATAPTAVARELWADLAAMLQDAIDLSMIGSALGGGDKALLGDNPEDDAYDLDFSCRVLGRPTP